MNEKYTIGDLAKEAGITTKAIRIYEKKGLIKPAAYSEGNYRLYDNEAKIILQKIMTLKFVGFSLDEIRSLLEKDKENDILNSLSYQKKLLELKRDHIDRVIYCVDRAAQRCSEGKIDWGSFTDIMHAVIIDRNADEGHWAAMKYGINEEDWYEKIYKNISIGTNKTILDIGCGYGNLWRNNWSKIPQDVKVTLMDIHGTWADDFAKFVQDNSDSLPKGTCLEFVWENVENGNSFTEKYNLIIANYLFRFIKDREKLMHKIKISLSADGTFYCINGGNTVALEKIAALLKNFDESINSIEENIKQLKEETEVFERQLNSIFDKVEWTVLNNRLEFKNAIEFYEYLIKKDFAAEYNLEKQREKFEVYFSKVIDKEGRITIPSETNLYLCK